MTSLETNHKFAPGLRGLSFFRLLPSFQNDTLATFANLSEQFGDTVCLRGLWTAYIIINPRDVEYVLQTNNQNYWKGKSYQILKHSTGNGLFTSEGAEWLRQRRLAQPVFHHQKIAAFAKTITDCIGEMLVRWEKLAENEKPFDVVPEMMRLTLGIVGKALFNADLATDAGVFGDAFEVVRRYTTKRLMSLVKIPRNVPTPLNLRFARAIQSVDKIVYKLIEERRASPTEFNDLLAMLMAARDADTDEAMSNLQLRDEAMTIIGAGYETTTQALGWTWYLLDKHPEIEANLRSEIETVLNGRTATFDDLPRLEYTRMVFQEALRLYPPVWGFGRAAINDDRISGYYVPAKTEILLFPFITHRHPEFWQSPDEFEPERFTAQASAGRPKFAYFPFGGGHRQCIGNNFAMMEAVLIIVTIMQKFRVRLVSKQIVEPETSVTLRPRFGIKVTLAKTHDC